MEKSVRILLLFLWLAATVVGVAGLVERILHGHQQAAYGSYIVWGLWVSAYIYFIGLSAGAFLLSSLITVFGIQCLKRVGKLSLFVAIVTLFMALISIWFDLGRMERFYRVFTSPNFGSMMAWMVWLYTAYFLVMVAELWLALREDFSAWTSRNGIRGTIGRVFSLAEGPLTEKQKAEANHWVKVLAVVGVPLAVTFHGGVGALFSTLVARPFWHTPLMPILFLTGALVSGGALMAFTVTTYWPTRDTVYRDMVAFLGRVVLGLLLFDVVLEWAEFSVPMWYGVGHEYRLLTRVLFGEFWWVFWILHVGLGTLVPILLLSSQRGKPWSVGVAGFLITLTFMTVRLNVVIPGLIDPPLEGLQNAFVDPRLKFSYVPSFFEWQIVFLVIAVGCALFYLGYRFLPLTEEKRRLDETP